MARPRVFLVDDHPLMRSGIRMLLELHGNVEVVGEASSAEEALERVPGLAPDVVLLDLSLPGLGGIDAARALQLSAPGTRLVALSMHEDTESVYGFLRAGGTGYVPKSALESQLLDAVHAVLRGEYYVPAGLVAKLARSMSDPDPFRDARLTPRETDVIRRIAEGLTYREIAASLGISKKTVATYRERASEKLGVHTRAELVRWALEHGLLR